MLKKLSGLLMIGVIGWYNPSLGIGILITYIYFKAALKPNKSLEYDLDKLPKNSQIVQYFVKNFEYKHRE